MVVESGIPKENGDEGFRLLQQSYGYYLIPKDGSAHSLVESVRLELEKQRDGPLFQ